MPARRIVLLVALIFIATLVWRMPVRWVLAALPANMRCELPSGTAWNGHCARLTIAAESISEVRWQLQAGPLLRGKLGALLRIQDSRLDGSAKLLFGTGRSIHASDIEATLLLPSTLVRGTPPGLSGTLRVHVPTLDIDAGQLTSIAGTLQLRNVKQLLPPLQLGDYEWQLLAGPLQNGRVSGTLRDLGGPLTLRGTLALTFSGEFELEAKARPVDGTDESLTQALEALGPADADGMRSLSVAGSL
jgi:Type II secretion system (T2SS), protein N